MLPPNEWRDFWLVQKARNGDQRAFESLYHRHKRRVYGMLCRLTGNTSDAEDLMQETFLAALKGISAWKGQAAFSTYLCGIAYRLYCASRRKPVAEALDETEEIPDSQDDPLRRLSESQRTGALESAIQTLPDGCREAFVLVRIEEMNYREVALILGIPLGTVQSRIFRANRLLRHALSEWVTDREVRPAEQESSADFTKGATRHALR